MSYCWALALKGASVGVLGHVHHAGQSTGCGLGSVYVLTN